MTLPQERVAVAAAVLGTCVAGATMAGLAGAWFRASGTVLPSPFGPGWHQILIGIVATAFTVAAWLGVPAPWTPIGVTLLLMGWLVPLWSAWTAPLLPVRAALVASSPLVIPGVLACLLAGRRPPERRPLLTMVAGLLALAAVALHVLGYNPFADPRCALLCADIPPVLGRLLTTRGTVLASGVLTVAAAIIGVAIVARSRSVPSVVRVGALMALLNPILVGVPQPDSTRDVLGAGALACLAAALLGVEIRSWRTRSAVERLVTSLGDPDSAPASDGRIDAVHFAVDERWIDRRGDEVTTDRTTWLVLTDGSTPSVRLGLLRAGDRDAVLAALTPAIRLTLTNARLAAVVRSRVLDVQASQRRIVNASDRERRRLERDLHDGAQQYLVSIALHLSAARLRLPPGPAAELSSAEEAVHEALAGLRRLAHGIFPAALGDEGLAAALEDAVTGSAAIVRLEADLHDTEPDLGAAVAAYATTVLMTESAGADAEVDVRVAREGAWLHLEVSATRHGLPTDDAFDDVRDRIGALGGTLSVRQLNDVLKVEAVIPCELWSPTT